MKKIISKETIKSFIKEMSLAKFYENVAAEFGVDTPDKYDCTKINVAVNIYDQWYEQWAKETDYPDCELSMRLMMCGPKADGKLQEDEVEILPGFYEAKTSILGVDAYKVDINLFEVCLRNGKSIWIETQSKHKNHIYPYKVESQYFTAAVYAQSYLKELIQEKTTGMRVIHHRKQTVPDICGVNGAACRAKGEYNRGLCCMCPIAEEFYAKQDGVTLVYVM